MKYVRSVPWEFGDVIPDYVLGQTTCALFLRYVNHPRQGYVIVHANDHFQILITFFPHVFFLTVFFMPQSLRYHHLNPNYIHDRLKHLGQTFTLRVLLVQVDVVNLQNKYMDIFLDFILKQYLSLLCMDTNKSLLLNTYS